MSHLPLAGVTRASAFGGGLFELPGLTHLLHGQNPPLVAKGLAGFFTCHPIPESL
jgi:hypothetical protein